MKGSMTESPAAVKGAAPLKAAVPRVEFRMPKAASTAPEPVIRMRISSAPSAGYRKTGVTQAYRQPYDDPDGFMPTPLSENNRLDTVSGGVVQADGAAVAVEPAFAVRHCPRLGTLQGVKFQALDNSGRPASSP